MLTSPLWGCLHETFDLAGYSVTSKVRPPGGDHELIKANSAKIDGAAITRALAAQVDKANRNEWIAALRGLEAIHIS